MSDILISPNIYHHISRKKMLQNSGTIHILLDEDMDGVCGLVSE